MATKPTVTTEWATQFTNAGPSGNPNKDEPTQAFKDFGQPEALPVDRQSLNYELNALDQWRLYFEEKTDELSSLATTTTAGLVELATESETFTGTANKIPDALQLKNHLAKFGINAPARLWPNGINLNDLSGAVYSDTLYRVFAQNPTTADGWPQNYSGNNDIVVKVYDYGSRYVQRVDFLRQNGTSDVVDIWERSDHIGDGSWGAWANVLTTSNSVDPTEFGIGVDTYPNLADINVVTKGSLYPYQFGATGSPNGQGGTVMTITRDGNKWSSQFSLTTSVGEESSFFRNYNDGVWTQWYEYYHSNNSINPLEWGLGNERARDTNDWNTAKINGFWKSEGAGTYINSPNNNEDGWQGFVSSLNNQNVRQVIWRSGLGNYDMYMRWGDGSSPTTWGPWIRMITEDNIAAYIPNQINWERRTVNLLGLNTKNILDLDTLTNFQLPALSGANDLDFVTVRPSTAPSKSTANYSYTITTTGSDQIRTRSLDKLLVTDDTVIVDLMTEITFINNNGIWEY